MEILSNASDEETQQWVDDLQTTRQVAELVWPIKLSENRPMTFILCKDARTLEDFGFVDFYREKQGLTAVFAEGASDWERLFFIQDTALGRNRRLDRWKRISQIYSPLCSMTEPRPPEWMPKPGQDLWWSV